MGGSDSVLHAIVSAAVRTSPAHAALTYGDDTWTYAQLWDSCRAVAAGLRRDGLRRGDRVAVYLDKRLETVAALFGTSCASGVLVPVNPVLRAAQVGYIVRDAGCRVLVTTSERYYSLRTELGQCESLEVVVLVGAGEPAVGDDAYRIRSWSELVAEREWPPREGSAEPAIDVDPAAILYTSGSTGMPKGVVLSHRNLRAGADSVSEYLENTADDVILAALPLSFDAGLSQLTTGFTVGAHVVLHNYLLPADVVTACGRHRVTGLTGVPPLWIQIADQAWPPDVTASLRYFANTGGRMPRPLLARLREHFPTATPFLMYGLTEAFRSTYLDPEEVDRRPDSIGKAIPNTEILVVRPDGSPCEPGEVGELVHRGALVALGYWNDPERTALRFRPPPGGLPVETGERAVWSGDLVRADEDGFLYFVGRNDEMIKTSGYRVSPTEIEEIAFRSGLVRDAVALGDDDPALGQRVVLIVTPSTPGQRVAEGLQRHFRRNAPNYMLPAVIDERSTIPRGPNGKYDRTWLRQERAS
jgi:acyl-CoA ligase (AMP-forming) (exosortase A-associated)